MKKYVVIALMLTITLSLAGCLDSKKPNKNHSEQETALNTEVNLDTQKAKKELSDIIVHDVNPGTPYDCVEEIFFEDERYIYKFEYPKSDSIIAQYTDGSQQNVKDALKDGNITLSNLNACNIKYISEPKNIKTIIDHAERDILPTSDALEGFYADDNYVYYFSSIRSQHVIVYFKDGTQKPVKDALRDGSVCIQDLGYFKIGYMAEPIDADNSPPRDYTTDTVIIDIPDGVKSINVKHYYCNTGTTETVLLTAEEDITRLCNNLKSLKMQQMDYVKPTARAFELTFLNKDSSEIKIIEISANTATYITLYGYGCCSVKEGTVDVEFLENLFNDKKKEVVDIKVSYVSPCDVEEPFYEDDVYVYSFGNPQSAFTTVKYSDGTEQRLVDALRERNIKITDLDTFDIKYWSYIKPVENPELTYEAPISNDYVIPTDLPSMIKAVEFAVIGTYNGTASTYATEIGQIISIGRISDIQIIKGDASSDINNISFYGGALPVSKFMQYAHSDISAKCGYDKLTKFEADTKYVGVPVTKYTANPIENTKYLFLLSYDKSKNNYFVACDSYGIREINEEGKVWNPDTETFEAFPYK